MCQEHRLTHLKLLSYSLDSKVECSTAPGCKEVGDISQGWMVVVPKYIGVEFNIWENYINNVTFLVEMRSYCHWKFLLFLFL